MIRRLLLWLSGELRELAVKGEEQQPLIDDVLNEARKEVSTLKERRLDVLRMEREMMRRRQ